MSWLDRLKGKGGVPDEPQSPDERAPQPPTRPAPPMPRMPRASERRVEGATEVDLDALLGDIASGLAPTRPTIAERPEAGLQRRPRLDERMRQDDPFASPAAPAVRAPQAAPTVDGPKLEHGMFATAPRVAPPVQTAPRAPDLPTAPLSRPEPGPHASDFQEFGFDARAPEQPEPELAEEPALPDEPDEPALDPRSPEVQMAEALAAATAGDYETALAIWEPLARAGTARAQNNIGACFVDGLGVEQDLDLARRWLELAAEGGDPVGRRNLATLYFKGQGVEPDYARAADLYRAAAEDGDGPAQDMLSWMLLEGEVMPPDSAEARRWALAAADQGIASSMTRLGMIAHNALGMERDAVEAARWWRKGAEAGDADGQAMLGAAYHLGAGVPRDRIAAFAWLVRARTGHSALADRFFDAVRAMLTPEEEAAALRRAAIPLGELP